MREPSYDDFPYPGYAFAATHPDQLAAVAHLHGLDAPELAGARVLEIGCGTGGNLIPLAAAFPSAQFVGFDLAARAIADGRAEAARLGLANLELAVGDIMATAPSGRFDFIIAHGVYSWVPEPVRARLLELYGALLSERGLGFLSFAAYPGGFLTSMLHAMAKFHVRGTEDPRAAVDQVRGFARLLTAAAAGDDPTRGVLRHDAAKLADHDGALIAHDVLSDAHHCAWLHDVADRLAALGLQYVADARITPQVALMGQPALDKFLALAGDDRVLRAQYLDFARVTRFREIVIARAGTVPAPHPLPARIGAVRLRGEITISEPAPSLAAGTLVRFVFKTGNAVTLDDPLAKAALLAIGAAFPRGLAFDEVVAASVGALRAVGLAGAIGADPAGHLAEALAALLGGELLRPAMTEPPIARDPGARPRAIALARDQLATGSHMTNLRHETVELDAPGRQLMLLLDGTRDRAALAVALGETTQRIDEMLAILHRRSLLTDP